MNVFAASAITGSKPPTTKCGACKTCRKAKTRCTRTDETQVKCDRCLRLQKPCEPHISIQGQRPHNGNNKKGNSIAADRCRETSFVPESIRRQHVNECSYTESSEANGKIKYSETAAGSDQDCDFGDILQYCTLRQSENSVHDWLKNEGARGNDSDVNQPSIYDDGTSEAHDINQYFEDYLKSFEQNVQAQSFDGSDEEVHAALKHNQPLIYDEGTAEAHDMNQYLEDYLKSFEQNMQDRSFGGSDKEAEAALIQTAYTAPRTSESYESIVNPKSRFVISTNFDANSIAQSQQSDAKLPDEFINTQMHHSNDHVQISHLKELENTIGFMLANTNISSDIHNSLSSSANDASNLPNQSTIRPTLKIPLKLWIKDTLEMIGSDGDHINQGINSSTYLTAALQISLSLAKQVHNSVDVSSLGVGINWVDRIIVHLNPSGMLSLRSSLDAPKSYYLDIHSAEILRGNTLIISNDFNLDKAKSTFYLGLVLYVIFSRGQSIPNGLLALTRFDDAFVSLPRLSLCDDPNDDDKAVMIDAKRRERRGRKLGLCEVSCENLRILGIPSPICSLIFNMMECIYGDFAGEEAFSSIADVISDLQLMLDKPKFMHGLAVAHLPSASLQLEEFKVPRDKEHRSIISCYNRCISSGSCMMAIVKGVSGIGKSYLSRQVTSCIEAEGGIVLTAKFDQMKEMHPLSALSSAFDQYCELVLEKKETDWGKCAIDKLEESLGRDACRLTKIIPKLALVLNDVGQSIDSNYDENSRNALQRLYFLICRFVDVICTCSVVSVTLFLDDMQWADEASLAILNELLKQRLHKFFLIACCRDDEMASDHRFWNIVKNVEPTIVDLKGAQEDTIKKLLSNMMCLSPRLVRSLASMIYRKTKGNILFIIQILLLLNRDGLIFFDVELKRWRYSQDKIASMKLPDNIASYFVGAIGKLPIQVQLALRTLSMFGASVNIEYMKLLETKLGLPISEPMSLAEEEGLVTTINGAYSFCHDRIQEASYKMIQEYDRVRNHLMYGRYFISHFADTDADDVALFIAVNQINCGGASAVTDNEELLLFAKYNVIAGKKALAMSQFSAAYSFFTSGISFLPCNYWHDHYEFSLEIFELSCRSALASSNISAVQSLSGELLSHAKSFDDQLNTRFMVFSSLVASCQLTHSQKMGLELLQNLGAGISSDLSCDKLKRQKLKTAKLLATHTSESLLSHPLMTDKHTLTAMSILARLQSVAHLLKSSFHPFLIIKMIELTMTSGLAPSSAMGFACLGSYYAADSHLEIGRQFTAIAQSLLQQEISKQLAAEVLMAVSEVRSYLEPLLVANELRVQGMKVAESVGDIHSLCILRYMHGLALFHGGSCLDAVKQNFCKSLQFFKQHEHKFSFTTMSVVERTVLLLAGYDQDGDMNRLNDVVNTLREVQEVAEEGGALRTLLFHDMLLALIFSKDTLKECCEALFPSFNKKSFLLLYNDAVQTYIFGLASYRVHRETGDIRWLDRGRAFTNRVKLWAEQGCASNFKQKMLLMLAEENYCDGNVQKAKELYSNAISTANEHGFLNDEALSCELAGYFYLSTRDLSLSLQHFTMAHEKYGTWGAFEKARQLFSYMNETFSLA